MKYPVPYFEQNQKYKCGTTNLRMALAYLGKKVSFSKAKKLARQLESTATLLEGMALGADDLNLRTEYFATSFNIPRSKYFKKAMGKDGTIVLTKFKERIKSKDTKIQQSKKDLSLNKLLTKLTKSSIPIVSLNTNILDGKKGFNGHYVTIVGYDKKAIYVHNSGTRYPFPYWPIRRDLFMKAWSSKHADKRVLIIYKK